MMSGNAIAGAFPFGFAFAPPFAFAPCDFGRPSPCPFGFEYGVNAEVLGGAGPYLGGGPVGDNGEIDLGLLFGAGFLGGAGPGFVVPCVSALGLVFGAGFFGGAGPGFVVPCVSAN